MKADLLIFGNIVTMNEYRPYAEAVAIKGERIMYVGTKEIAKKLASANTVIYDYGSNSVYPGFLEAHCHPGGAGYSMSQIARLDRNSSLDECVKVMKEYIDAHPEKEFYSGSGFEEHDIAPHHSMLDAICDDKPVMCTDTGGHSMWLNSKAMEKYGINEEAVKRWGTSCVRVDEDGKPTGYISEGPVFYLRSVTKIPLEDMKNAVLCWQDYCLSKGYTAVYNAGVNLVGDKEAEAYYELEAEGKLKHYTFAGSMVDEQSTDPEGDIERISKEIKEHNSKHYNVIGAKVFCDGVVEGHTAWMLEDYIDEPGYRGVKRYCDHDLIVRLVSAANEHKMNVHVHTIGDAAIKAWVDGIAEAEEKTGDFDRRHALAHLQYIRDIDIQRIADYHIIPVCGLMWIQKTYAEYQSMVNYLGLEKALMGFRVNSFIKAGAVVVSHSDFPVSPSFSVPMTICLGAQGYLPSMGEEYLRNKDEVVGRMNALKALTTNVAYMWHQENNMGSLEEGKMANITVFDKDFLKDDVAEIENSKCLATFVDGQLVYKL